MTYIKRCDTINLDNNIHSDVTIKSFAKTHNLELDDSGERIKIEPNKVYVGRWLSGNVSMCLDSECIQFSAMTLKEFTDEFGEDEASKIDWMF